MGSGTCKYWFGSSKALLSQGYGQMGRCIGRWEVENDKKIQYFYMKTKVRMREKRCAGTMEVWEGGSSCVLIGKPQIFSPKAKKSAVMV